MTLHNTPFGTVHLEISIEQSSVDSFIQSGTKDDGTELTDDEIDILTDEYQGEIEEYAYDNGSINHN